MTLQQRRVQIPIVGPSSRSRTVLVNNQATVNFIQAIKGPGAKAPIILESAPGLVENATSVGDGPCRSPQMVSSAIRAAATENELYGVYGSKLVAQVAGGATVEIGTLSTSTGTVRIARGRNYIMVVDGTAGYTYDGTTFAAIADLDFPNGATHVVYIDGFFVVNDPATDNFYISAVEDPTSWNALDFEAAAVAPDAALALAATESILWIIGDETAQGFYNTGNPDFPYDIILSATQEVGILAPQSIAESDDGIFYLATTPEGGRFVYQIHGTQGITITGDEQENLLQNLADPSDAYGFIYKQAGKSFYVLQLGQLNGPDPRDNFTLIYNIKARAWESREINDGTAWRAAGHGVLDGDNLVGSRLQAANYILDLDDFQDAGEEMIRRRRSAIVHVNQLPLTFWSLIIDCEVGVGNATTPAPILQMRYSNDGGNTWSSWLERDLGAIGEYSQTVKYDKLGSSARRVFELQSSGAHPVTIIAAHAEISVDGD